MSGGLAEVGLRAVRNKCVALFDSADSSLGENKSVPFFLGVPLADIAEALQALPAERTPGVRDWRRLSRSWKQSLDERIHALTQLRDQLDGCIGCGCLSLQACPLRNPGDDLADEGPGPHFRD